MRHLKGSSCDCISCHHLPGSSSKRRDADSKSKVWKFWFGLRNRRSRLNPAPSAKLLGMQAQGLEQPQWGMLHSLNGEARLPRTPSVCRKTKKERKGLSGKSKDNFFSFLKALRLWLAQSLKHGLPLAQVMVSESRDWAPCQAHCSTGNLLLPFLLCLPTTHALSLLCSQNE